MEVCYARRRIRDDGQETAGAIKEDSKSGAVYYGYAHVFEGAMREPGLQVRQKE
jgi:hypothetical protein